MADSLSRTSTRRIRYQLACSLDGYIAGPRDEIDWLPMDPDIDFDDLYGQFDTLLMGRRTYETLPAGLPGLDRKRIIVYSRTLRQEDHPKVNIRREVDAAELDALRSSPGKDIWLFGGGELFRTFLELGYIDTVESAIVPILLGEGRPMLPSLSFRTKLQLKGARTFPKSGIVWLTYEVLR